MARALAASGRPRKHIADVAGCSADVFFDVLAGRVAIGLDRLDRIAAAVKWPAWALLNEVDEAPPIAPLTPETRSIITLACRTRALLVARGWSVPMLADRTALGKAMLYSVLAGHAGTSIDGVAGLARAFEVLPSAMLIPIVGGGTDVVPICDSRGPGEVAECPPLDVGQARARRP